MTRFGRDVAGAAVISPDGEDHRPGRVVDYPRHQLEADVAGLEERPLALHDDSELSLPGLQNKLLLVATSHGWGRPAAGYPSTHILKVEDRRYPGMATMEAACLRLARAIGVTDVEARTEQFAGLDCLIVPRFDRRADVATGSVDRLHQEDVCQALGTDIAPTQLRRLLRTAVFTQVIGNGDAHGKNLALLHTDPGTVVLAPLYDTVPTALWPHLPDRAAMWVNGKRRLSAVTGEDLVTEARSWPLTERTARQVVAETVDELLAAVTHVDLPEALADLVRTRARRLVDPT